MPVGSDRLFVNCQTEPRHWKSRKVPAWILLTVIRQRNNTTCTAEKALLQNGSSSSEYICVSIDKPSLSLLRKVMCPGGSLESVLHRLNTSSQQLQLMGLSAS